MDDGNASEVREPAKAVIEWATDSDGAMHLRVRVTLDRVRSSEELDEIGQIIMDRVAGFEAISLMSDELHSAIVFVPTKGNLSVEKARAILDRIAEALGLELEVTERESVELILMSLIARAMATAAAQLFAEMDRPRNKRWPLRGPAFGDTDL